MKTLVRVFLLFTFSLLAFKAEKLEGNTAMEGLGYPQVIAKRSVDRSIAREVSPISAQIRQKRSLLGNMNIFISDVLEDTGKFIRSNVPDEEETITTVDKKEKKNE